MKRRKSEPQVELPIPFALHPPQRVCITKPPPPTSSNVNNEAPPPLDPALGEGGPGPGEGFGMCDVRHRMQAGKEKRTGWLRVWLLAWLLICAGV
jgi:hypothetical protein